jgi:hypothetical protein
MASNPRGFLTCLQGKCAPLEIIASTTRATTGSHKRALALALKHSAFVNLPKSPGVLNQLRGPCTVREHARCHCHAMESQNLSAIQPPHFQSQQVLHAVAPAPVPSVFAQCVREGACTLKRSCAFCCASPSPCTPEGPGTAAGPNRERPARLQGGCTTSSSAVGGGGGAATQAARNTERGEASSACSGRACWAARRPPHGCGHCAHLRAGQQRSC